MDKKLTFQTYRYHLVPLSTNQLKVFEESLSIEELKRRKNEYFENVIKVGSSLSGKSNELPTQLIYEKDNVYIVLLAVVKSITLYKNFQPVTFDNQPYINIIINNDPKIQKILIQDNQDVFRETKTVKNILEKAFSARLAVFQLAIHIEPVINQQDFWDIIEKYKFKIQRIKFTIVKPNLADISKSLTEPIKELMDSTNSHKTEINLNAPEKGILENINEDNSPLKSLIDYSTQGGGDEIKIKVKNVRRVLRTSNTVKETYIGEAELTGNQQSLLPFLDSVFEK